MHILCMIIFMALGCSWSSIASDEVEQPTTCSRFLQNSTVSRTHIPPDQTEPMIRIIGPSTHHICHQQTVSTSTDQWPWPKLDEEEITWPALEIGDYPTRTVADICPSCCSFAGCVCGIVSMVVPGWPVQFTNLCSAFSITAAALSGGLNLWRAYHLTHLHEALKERYERYRLFLRRT